MTFLLIYQNVLYKTVKRTNNFAMFILLKVRSADTGKFSRRFPDERRKAGHFLTSQSIR